MWYIQPLLDAAIEQICSTAYAEDIKDRLLWLEADLVKRLYFRHW